nr:PEP/pyruvate-binding domain-containing protein [Micromonospora sp. DSM 115978]
MTDHPFVLSLGDPAATHGLVGGKGANLGKLLRGRFPVPGGFTVTTTGCDLILPARPADLLDQAPDGSAVRKAVETADFPAELVKAVVSAYRALGGGPVAVRSSTTAEDLPESASAGQQDTFLNVIGEENVLDSIRRCAASAWSERAIAYRRDREVNEVRTAVVVQRMVAADFSGVMFTANPVTGARHEVVIEVGQGLGEAVVSGRVTPDHYVLRKHRVRDSRSGKREIAVRALPGGGVEEVAGEPDRELPWSALKKLSKLGKTIERHFGAPQDIEWVWTDGRPWIVQSRPITALPDPPAKRSGQENRAVTMAEMLPVRPYPLDTTTWTGALFEAVHEVLEIAGKVPPVSDVREEQDGVVVKWDFPLPKPTAKTLTKIPGMLAYIFRYNPHTMWSDPVLVRLIERWQDYDKTDLTTMDWDGLRATLDEAMAVPTQLFQLRGRYMMRTFVGAGYVYLLLALRRQKGLMNALNALFVPTNSVTIEINREIEALATRVRNDEELARAFASHEPAELPGALDGHPFMAEFDTFLQRYGHREGVSLALASQPTWRAAPEIVLSLVKSFATTPPPPRNTPEATALRAQLLSTRFLRPLNRRALDQMAVYARMLEDTHFYLTLPLPHVRRVMLEFGRRLVEADLLDGRKDVFHLRLDEVQMSPGRREIVARRKAKRESLEGVPFVTPEHRVRTAPVGNALVSGLPGGSGVAEGPARIIRGPHEFGKLRTGDVLVAPYTHPAWTPLFQRAAAVIVDTGGPAAHAAIVAREYGIPAVMGTGDGTSTLVDGQPVRVDGDRGAVLPVE